MNDKEYEEYVAEVVKDFEFCRNATISRNRKFAGKRQPGNYEIDIAIEISYGELAYFLMIVECKHWKRRVDRPAIQKLIQTRDAIAAHKAFAVSPVGFSHEAIDVAKANGVALWVICPGKKSTQPISARTVNHSAQELFGRLRKGFLSSFGVKPRPQPLALQLRGLEDIHPNPDSDSPLNALFQKCHFAEDGTSFLFGDPEFVFGSIITDLFRDITSHDNWTEVATVAELSTWLHESEKQLRAFGVPHQVVNDAIDLVASDDWWAFGKLVSKPFA